MTAKQWLSFITLTIIWGASFLWIKLAVEQVGPFTIVTLRLVLAMLALVGFMILQKPGFPRGRHQWGRLFILGIISSAFPWLMITWSEIHIDSAMATVLNGTVPLFTIICAQMFISDDKMTRSRVVGLLVGFVGIVVLMSDGLRSAFSGEQDVKWQLLGQGAMLLGAASYGVANVYARAKFRDVSPLFQTFYSLLAADILMWMITPIVEAPFTLPVSMTAWLAIAWLGVLGAGFSYLLFYHLLHQIGPTRAATITYAIPVVGVTMGVVFLDEALTFSLIAGSVLIVSGVWWVNRK